MPYLKFQHLKNSRKLFLPIILILFFSLFWVNTALAEIEWEITKTITLDETPKDIVNSKDDKAYILCSKNILIYSLKENKITGKVPVNKNFSQIALSTDGESLLLTEEKTRELTIIKVTSIFDIEIGESPIIGNKDAPVDMVAFLDYQCPYCAKIYPTLEKLLKKYPKEVKMVIKHYPLRMHKFAKKASLAALAASKQDKYADLTKILIENFRNLNDDSIKKYAQESGVDMEAFEKAYNDASLQKIVSQDLRTGGKVGVRGVPALFINGRRVKNRSVDALSKMIEEELKKGKN